jgi:hypothetical protein
MNPARQAAIGGGLRDENVETPVDIYIAPEQRCRLTRGPLLALSAIPLTAAFRASLQNANG